METNPELELIEAYVEAFNSHDAALLAALHTLFGSVVEGSDRIVAQGRSQIADYYASIFVASPDFRWEKTHGFGRDGQFCIEWVTAAGSAEENASTERWNCGGFTIENDKVAQVRFYSAAA